MSLVSLVTVPPPARAGGGEAEAAAARAAAERACGASGEVGPLGEVFDPVSFAELPGGTIAARSTNACYAKSTLRRIMRDPAMPGYNKDPLTRAEYSAADRRLMGLRRARPPAEEGIPVHTHGLVGTLVALSLGEAVAQRAGPRASRALLRAVRQLGPITREEAEAEARAPDRVGSTRYDRALEAVLRASALGLRELSPAEQRQVWAQVRGACEESEAPPDAWRPCYAEMRRIVLGILNDPLYA